MKKYLALIFFSLVLILIGTRFHAEYAARYARAQKSTVLLESSTSFGSGVVTKKTNPNHQDRLFIWTAAHCVRSDNSVKVSQVVRLNGLKVGTINFTANVIARDSALDLALLWMQAPPEFFTTSAFDGATILPVGTKVFHCGNFNGVRLEGSVTTGVVSQVGPSSPDFPWQIVDQTSLVIERGSSGGGVFLDRSGSLVGIATGLIDSGVSLFVPARAVNTFCVVHKVEWAFTGKDCPSDGKLLMLQESAKVGDPNCFLRLILSH